MQRLCRVHFGAASGIFTPIPTCVNIPAAQNKFLGMTLMLSSSQEALFLLQVIPAW